MKEIHVADINQLNFHPVLKDIEDMFWFFLLSVRTLSDFDIQNLLKYKNSIQKGYEGFNQMLDKFNNITNLRIEIKGNVTTSKLDILKQMIFMGKAMAILTYDYLSLSRYNAAINKDSEFQFLRYIRNGAAHNNKFNLRDEEGNWKIEANEVIQWNNMKISRELQDKEVFNDFISVFGIFLLANHFSNRLKQIDSE